MDRLIDGQTITVDAEGYLTDFAQWSRTVGETLAGEAGLALTPRHWEVLTYLQSEFQKEVPLSIRRIGKSGVTDIKEFYQLFPTAPLKTAARIAGIPKPVSCL
ncbi:TusE/DsrC/DsvC family sulfur relay protein [Gemmatimonas phototrophica]|uniref:Sulfur relay protein DsrC n=1 Tax=Gemmatimonas phototrophica TaxID=1379270 RepID=A0A143BGH9_9BACT|nr:TusE/DsrC/DsvC family sulfur relay protein [Gemmatimonas phototrophica]AMW03711.1 sulfur relay protein DsrC [Gemmatimonas phototrophica]